MKVKKSVKKAADGTQTPKKSADSTGYFSRKLLKAYGEKDFAGAKKASDDVARQSKKGKPGYDKDGYPIKKKMKEGGSLKPVPADKEKSLGKLPTAVRNKMGFQKDGGKTKAKSGAALKKQAATAIAMKKAGKASKKAMMGGKCKYGC